MRLNTWSLLHNSRLRNYRETQFRMRLTVGAVETGVMELPLAWLRVAPARPVSRAAQQAPPPPWNGRLGPGDLSCLGGAAPHPNRLTPGSRGAGGEGAGCGGGACLPGGEAGLRSRGRVYLQQAGVPRPDRFPVIRAPTLTLCLQRRLSTCTRCLCTRSLQRHFAASFGPSARPCCFTLPQGLAVRSSHPRVLLGLPFSALGLGSRTLAALFCGFTACRAKRA